MTTPANLVSTLFGSIPIQSTTGLGSILLAFDDQPNGSTIFTNTGTINATFTKVGSPTVTTSSPISGAGSLLLPDTGSYLTATIPTFNAVSTPFTIECSTVFTANPATNNPILLTGGGYSFYPFQLYGGTIYCGDGVTNIMSYSGFSTSLNTLNTFALSYDGSVYRMYINGNKVIQTGSKIGGTVYTTMIVGARPEQGIGNVGKIDNVRFSPGVARYVDDTYTLPF